MPAQEGGNATSPLRRTKKLLSAESKGNTRPPECHRNALQGGRINGPVLATRAGLSGAHSLVTHPAAGCGYGFPVCRL